MMMVMFWALRKQFVFIYLFNDCNDRKNTCNAKLMTIKGFKYQIIQDSHENDTKTIIQNETELNTQNDNIRYKIKTERNAMRIN